MGTLEVIRNANPTSQSANLKFESSGGLQNPMKRQALKVMAYDVHLPHLLREDMKGIIHDWEKN